MQKPIFFIALALCFLPFIDAPLALLLGIIVAQLIDHPYPQHNKRATQFLLQFSVVGLGFGMNINTALHTGKEGLIFTIASIAITITLGYFLTKAFRIEKKTGYLISSGTAICGGSAIAAIAPLINPKENNISVALGVIFILNSVALFVFPPLGHFFSLSQQDFGLWSAIAIHDTSSVVGAAAKYGQEALQVATTIKLQRALWIIPVSFITAFLFKNKEAKVQIPWFILLFVVAMLLSTFVKPLAVLSPYIVILAKKGLTITLFLIGSGLSFKVIKAVGIKPLLLGILLWISISTISLLVILGAR